MGQQIFSIAGVEDDREGEARLSPLHIVVLVSYFIPPSDSAIPPSSSIDDDQHYFPFGINKPPTHGCTRRTGASTLAEASRCPPFIAASSGELQSSTRRLNLQYEHGRQHTA